MTYQLNQEVQQFGSTYIVARLYSLTDEEIIKYEATFRNRVTLHKISGDKGSDIYDFGLS